MLVETAIVAAALLTFILGVVELGAVGFEQLTIDAAGFLNAHQTVIGVNDPNGPNDATSQVFPNVKPSNYLGSTVLVAPTPAVPVDYGYNGTTTQQASASTNHIGGASIIQPYILQTNLQKTLFRLFGVSVNVKSSASEPDYLETNLDYGVSNLNYGLNNTSSLYRNSLFSYGEETPQFFAVWANIQECDNAPAWTTTTCVNSASYIDPLSPSNLAPGYGPREDSMGMGAFLDTNNWANGGSGTTPGISGPVCTTSPCSTTGPFEAAACHQRIFSAIATFISANSNLNTIETTYDPMLANAVQKNNIQFFGEANAFMTNSLKSTSTSSCTGQSGSYTCPAMPNNFAQNVTTVYGWDLDSLNTYTGVSEGVNLLHPTAGCT
ncbi:MAG: TadE family protein [Candidatus Baltobacteraceae bacterium]